MSLLGEAFGNKPLTAESTVAKHRLHRFDELLGKTLYIVFSISTALLVAGLAGKLLLASASDDVRHVVHGVLAFGLVGLCIWLLLIEYKLWFADWLLHNALLLERAFLARDRRGRRLPGSTMHKMMDWMSSSRTKDVSWRWSLIGDPKLFDNQPDDLLIALIAVERKPRIIPLALKLLSATSASDLLRRYPDCSVLTKMDFANSRDSNTRRTAVELLPRRLWSRAIKTLLRSTHPEARIAAVRCEGLRRRTLLDVCIKDRDRIVRHAAHAQIELLMTEREALALSRSPHADVRELAVRSGLLARTLVLEIGCQERDLSVCKAAWSALETKLTAKEAQSLSFATTADVRLWAVDSNKLARERLLALCINDDVPQVRTAALAQVKPELTRAEAARLSHSRHSTTRSCALESGYLSDWRLFWVSHLDKDETIRRMARAQRQQRRDKRRDKRRGK